MDRIWGGGIVSKIGVVMGSTSDLPVVEKAIHILEEYQVPFEVRVLSAHRCPNEAREFAASARESGFSVLIAAAGMAAHLAGALIGVMTTNPVIAAIGTCLGRGTVISIVLVMAVLPQILLIGDTIVERTSFDVKVPVDLSRVNRTASGNMRVSGRVRGYVNGVIDAEIKGTLNGTLKASVTSGTTIEPTKPDFYLPESKEQAAAEWAENYTEGEEV